jgi:biopolymer transport protein ExbB
MTVAAQQEALGRTELLAAGIYQALVTTAVGLCIAIPAIILHHVFIEKVVSMITEMDDLSADLVDHISA